jgi:dihydrodipicolinate synthase/N-acetylneuraminate lyase
MTTATMQTVADRVEALDWAALTERMDADGFVQTPSVYTATECRELAATFDASAKAPTRTSTTRCPS